MELKHDPEADAIYIYLSSKPYAYGHDLDDERRIDYADDNSPVGVELLCVSRDVNITGLPQAGEIAKLLAKKGIKAYYDIGVLSGTSGSDFQYSFELPSTPLKRVKEPPQLHEVVTA